MRKIVVTGGPYAGKTTLVEALRAEGCAVAPEAALQVIAALADELGPERARAWREEHPERFQVRIAELQLELEARAERSGTGLVACDRGLLDGIAYCRHRGIETPAPVAEAAARSRYDLVLLCDTLTPFRPRPETGRVDDRHDSLALRDLIEAVYREYELVPQPVPQRAPDERLALVRRLLDH